MNLMFKFTLLAVFIFLSLSYSMGASISAGEYFSLALKDNGTVLGWGINVEGELGDGTTEERHTPVRVSGLTDVISISAGSMHSLALKRDGTAWAWGYNAFGQLGNGTASHYSPTPGQVIGLSGVIGISGGGIHSLFVKSDGTVWACGSNRNGQLGDGTTTDRHTPVQVSGLSGIMAIAGGGEHSLALKSDGTVWAWGNNNVGQLGDGNGACGDIFSACYSTVPVQVSGLSNVTAIAGGYVHSLALKNDGTVWAWGWNLGDGRETNSLTPVQSLVSGIIAIAGGDRFSLALTSYGTIWFWGDISLDPNNTGGEISSTIPVPVDGISGVKTVGGGDNHVLAVKNDGTVWAWGNNSAGQVGDGTTTSRRSPVQVQGFSTDSSDPVINPDVKVNSANGPLTVSAGTPITVTVQISPAYLGLEADWWIAAQGGGAWFYLAFDSDTFALKWLPMTNYTEMQPIYQGPLAPIGPVPIIESEYWLPRGDYEFFFAVDTVMDGILTLEALHYDSAILTIQ